jgi:hypothetical protein
MSQHHTDARVDEYINSLPDWQQTVCQKVRELVHQADPEVHEEIKRRVQPYFTNNGKNIIALLGTKDHVTVFLYGPGVSDPEGLINLPKGSTGSGVKIYQNEKINVSAMLDIFKQIAKRNRAGGWRKIIMHERTPGY